MFSFIHYLSSWMRYEWAMKIRVSFNPFSTAHSAILIFHLTMFYGSWKVKNIKAWRVMLNIWRWFNVSKRIYSFTHHLSSWSKYKWGSQCFMVLYIVYHLVQRSRGIECCLLPPSFHPSVLHIPRSLIFNLTIFYSSWRVKMVNLGELCSIFEGNSMFPRGCILFTYPLSFIMVKVKGRAG